MKTKNKRSIVILLLAIILFLPMTDCFTSIVQAADGLHKVTSAKSGWIEHDGEIYEKPSVTESATGGVSDSSNDDPGLIEKLFGVFIYGIATGINALEKWGGIGISNVVFGRVCGFGQSVSGSSMTVSYYTFELVENNPYGYVGALLYASFRGVAMVVMVCILAFKLASAAVSQSSSVRESLKSTATNYLMVVILMYIMPYCLDIAIYIRDHLLYAIGKVSMENFGELDLWKAFSENYKDSKSFISAVMCLGVVILSLYLALSYVSIALGVTIAFIVFPFNCVMSSFDKESIGRWVKDVLGNLLTPCIDAVLLIIPLMMGRIGAPAFIQLLLCMVVVPARQTLKQLLGLNTSALGGAGLMGAMSAMMMARSAARGIGKIANKVKGASADRKSAKMEQDMANEEAQEKMDASDQFNGENGYNGTRVTTLPQNFGKNRESMQRKLDEANAHFDRADELENSGDILGASEERTQGEGIIERNGLGSYVMPKSEAGNTEDRLIGATRLAAANGVGLNDISNEFTGNAERDLGILKNENNDLTNKKNDLSVEIAGIQKQMDLGAMDVHEGRAAISKKKEAIAEINKQVSLNTQKMDAIKEEQQSVAKTAKSYGASVDSVSTSVVSGSGMGRYSGGGMSSQKQNAIEMRYANYKNFDSGAFSSLSHQQKANFYKQRAAKQLRSAVGNTVGAAFGSVAGMGAGVFLGGSAMAVGALGGGHLGGAIGGATAQGAGVIKDVVIKNVRSGRSVTPPTSYRNSGGYSNPSGGGPTGGLPPISVNVSGVDYSGSYVANPVVPVEQRGPSASKFNINDIVNSRQFQTDMYCCIQNSLLNGSKGREALTKGGAEQVSKLYNINITKAEGLVEKFLRNNPSLLDDF